MDKAFEILAGQYRPMLLCYATTLLYGDTHKAEDVVQETLLAAHQSLDTFREGENFARWLRGIARNKVFESQRAARKQRMVTDQRVIEGIEDVYEVFDTPLLGEEPYYERMKRWVRQCVGRLSGHLRDAVLRVYRDGMNLREAATVENASSVAIAKRLSRARDMIRKCVQIHKEDER